MSTRAPRSRTFTGCVSCRSRHIRCDEGRPGCWNCKRSAATCEYATELLWVGTGTSTGSNEDTGSPCQSVTAYRHALFTEREREQMTRQMVQSLRAHSLSQTLLELESCDIPFTTEESVVAGPFGAFRGLDLPGTDSSSVSTKVSSLRDLPDDGQDTLGGTDPSVSHPEQIEDPGVHFNNADYEFQELTGVGAMGSPDLLHLFDTLHQPAFDLEGSMESREMQASAEHEPESQMTWCAPGGTFNLQTELVPIGLWSDDISTLFRYYQSNVIRPATSFFRSRKSPWMVILLPAATQTYADISIWGQASETRRCMFYSLLAISALHRGRSEVDDEPRQHWLSRGLEAHNLAKEHLKRALQYEVQGPARVKYKDLLMAILAMVMISALNDSKNIRSYLLDAEQLIRLRGIPKPVKSTKVRLLHHTYTHLRIIVESVYPWCKVEADTLSSTGEPQGRTAPRLHNFRLSSDHDNLELDPMSPKDDETASNDIHLEVLGTWRSTLYRGIYGVSESLMTLLSQTICLANEKLQLAQTANPDPQRQAQLSRHIKKLEQNIWKCKPTESPTEVHSTETEPSDDECDELSSLEIRNLNSAFQCALLIYYYRRIHNTSPMVLQEMVAKTLEYLGPCMQGGSEERDFATSIAWTCFIAATEAMSDELRDISLTYLSRCDKKGSFWAPWEGVRGVREVWRQRELAEDCYISWERVMASGGTSLFVV